MKIAIFILGRVVVGSSQFRQRHMASSFGAMKGLDICIMALYSNDVYRQIDYPG